MTTRLCCVTLLCLSFAAYSPTGAKAALLLQISPGPAANQTTWTFSGDTAAGFGNFRQSGTPNEAEPFGFWGDFPNFTTHWRHSHETLRHGDLGMDTALRDHKSSYRQRLGG